MKFGPRVIKTGLAIGLAMYVTNLLGNDAFIYAGLIAMFAVQPSIYRSYVTMFDQFKGNIVGAIVATSIVLLFGNSFFMVSIAAMITISLCVKFNVLDKVPSLVTVVAIMESHTGDYSTIEFAFVRFTAVTIGFFTAFFVNVFLFPPKHEKRLLALITDLNEKIRAITNLYFEQPYNEQKLQKEIHQLEKNFKNLYTLYNFFHEEKHFPKPKMRSHYRKIVVMKQFIITTKLNHQLLKKFKKNEHAWHHLPNELQQMIQAHTQQLQNYHDELLCKIKKKDTEAIALSNSASISEESTQILHAYNQAVTHLNNDTSSDKKWVHILPLLSHMLEYEEELIHLDHVIHSYYTYHQNKNTFLPAKKQGQLLH